MRVKEVRKTSSSDKGNVSCAAEGLVRLLALTEMNFCHLLDALAKGLSKYSVRNAFRMIAKDER